MRRYARQLELRWPEGSGLPVLRTELGLRVAFAEALTAGQGPTTYDPDGRAAAETWKLIDELEKLTTNEGVVLPPRVLHE